MYLNELFEEAPKLLIEQLSCDSRLPMKNCIFFCMSGVKYDGHDYIKEAIDNGANVIVYTKDIDTSYNVVFIKVKNINVALSNAAKLLYNLGPNDIDLFITCGCYGKSSVSSYINQLVSDSKSKASIGAYGINYADKQLKYPSATLTLLDNYRYLADIKNAGCNLCTLEVNALSLSYNKLEGLYPKACIYTNTSQYSKDFKGFSHKYYDSLRKYLYTLEESTLLVLNRDDFSYNELISAASNNIVTYGFDQNSTFQILNDSYFINKTVFDIKFDNNIYHIESPLLTKMNVYNLTAAIAAVVESKCDTIENVIERIPNLVSPEGIIEKLDIEDKNIIIDYCYSLDSYIQIHDYFKQLKDINKLYVVMSVNYGDKAESLSKYFNYIKDISFLTIFTENMIYEQDIHELLDEASICADGYNFLTIEDRNLAIKTAVDLLDKDDLLLILGKGNEIFFHKNYNKVVYEGDKNVVLEYIK